MPDEWDSSGSPQGGKPKAAPDAPGKSSGSKSDEDM